MKHVRNTIRRFLPGLVLLALALGLGLGEASAQGQATSLVASVVDKSPAKSATTFQVHQALTVKNIPDGAKKVRIWAWFPDDEASQKVLNYEITKAPGTWKLTRDPINGHRYLYAEQENPGATVVLDSNFLVRRSTCYTPLDADKAGPITPTHKSLFAEYLRMDCPCMQVDERLVELANKLCGDEKNVVHQARKIFDWVIANTDHYSKKNAPKSSGKGSAQYCLDNKGGGCTDQHALFIALCRARGIPTRLQFGSRLNLQNEGKDYDPGYRCWVQYFVPNYGWVCTDLSAANTTKGKEDFFFSGLDENRLWFMEGRDLDLNPRQTGSKVNLLLVAHVEVDGRQHTAFDRVVRFHRVKD